MAGLASQLVLGLALWSLPSHGGVAGEQPFPPRVYVGSEDLTHGLTLAQSVL